MAFDSASSYQRTTNSLLKYRARGPNLTCISLIDKSTLTEPTGGGDLHNYLHCAKCRNRTVTSPDAISCIDKVATGLEPYLLLAIQVSAADMRALEFPELPRGPLWTASESVRPFVPLTQALTDRAIVR